MKGKVGYWLLAIFLITIVLRLTIAFLTPNLTYDSYFHVRHVEYIADTGLPLYSDPLSYGGRINTFLPFFHYFTAFLSIFIPLGLLVKLIPNIAIATLTILVYLISKKITNNENASLFSAAIAGVLPILYSTNYFGPSTLFLPLVFLLIYSFMNIKESFHVYLYILTFLILSVTSPSTIFILIGFLIYLLLSVLESKRINKSEIEIMIFSLFFFLWVQFIVYKEVLLKEGLGFIWQNVPTQIIQQYFPVISVAEALVLISIIPFVAGIFVVYRSLFQLKNQKAFLLISLAISTTILTWLKVIEFGLSLSFFAIILAILFAIFYQDLSRYVQKTKFYNYHKGISLTLAILVIITIIPPALNVALNQEIPSNEEIDAFKWLKDNAAQDAVVAAELQDGHLITYYSKKKNFIDNQFNLIKDIDKRFKSLNSLFLTKFQTQAISIFDDHKISYLVLTENAKNTYNIKQLDYVDEDCFDLVYDAQTKIYKVRCELTAGQES
jgi:hypothetical protein